MALVEDGVMEVGFFICSVVVNHFTTQEKDNAPCLKLKSGRASLFPAPLFTSDCKTDIDRRDCTIV